MCRRRSTAATWRSGSRCIAVIHRREALTAEAFGRRLEAARAEVLRCGTSDVPETKHSRNLAKRFEVHRGDPSPGGPDRRGVWTPTRSGTGRGVALWHVRCAGDEAQPQPGEAVRGARGELFPIRHDARGGADEQPGGASDPVRGDRPPDHAGDTE